MIKPRLVICDNCLSIQDEYFSISMILKNLKIPSIGLVLFLVGLNLLYYIPVLIPSSRESGSSSGTYRYVFGAQLLILLGSFLETKASGYYFIKRYPIWVIISVITLITTSCLSRITGFQWFDIFISQEPFIWLLFVPAVALKYNNILWLIIILLIQALFGSIHSIYEIFIIGNTTREALLNQSDTFIFFGQSTYMSVFLLLLIPIFKSKYLTFIAVISYFIDCMNSFLAAKRYPILLIPVIFSLLIYLYYRRGIRVTKISYSKYFFAIITSFILIFTIFIFNSKNESINNDMIYVATKQISERFNEKGNITNTINENKRWDESNGAIGIMTLENWLIGKGVLNNQFNEGMIVVGGVHNSYLNSFFLGGISLFLMLIIPLFMALKVLYYSHNPIRLASAAFIFFIYLKFPAFGVYTISSSWLLFCLLIGSCAISEYSVFVKKQSSL